MPKIWIFNSLTFLSAFLLFQIELIIAKTLLPYYGGSYQVWGACVVFFQLILLLGYVFTHIIIKRISTANIRHVFLGLLFLPLLFFPGRELAISESNVSLPLSVDVFVRLLFTIGPVFFVLSTMGVLTQVWLSLSDLKEKKNPYALYAVSNLGSLGALVTYPFFFELNFGLSGQFAIWRVLYGVLLVTYFYLYFKVTVLNVGQQSNQVGPSTVTRNDKVRWFVLSASGVVLFLAVTNILTYQITPFPLLWIIPLAIYLLAYILNFKQKPWCPVWISEHISIILGWSVLLFALGQLKVFPVMVHFAIYLIILFILCLYCQNQLITHKPQRRRDLTQFYVLISFGGFVGGFVTSWIIPLVSNTTIEFIFGLALVSCNLIFDEDCKKVKWATIRAFIYLLLMYMFGHLLYQKFEYWSILFFFAIVFWSYREMDDNRNVVALSLLCFVVLWASLEPLWTNQVPIYRKRNYYGIYSVVDRKFVRLLLHGTITHGGQFIHKNYLRVPMLYYTRTSEIGELIVSKHFNYKKVGILGLGVGSLITYFNEKQELNIYEIDPEIVHIARKYFTYLNNFKGKLNMFIGDARIVLENQTAQNFDILFIDAFSGDSVPTHLLTVEGIEVYRKHMAPGGILLFHITNPNIRLRPVIAKNAQLSNAHVAYIKSKTRVPYGFNTEWMFLCWDGQKFDEIIQKMNWQDTKREEDVSIREWTDNYSNILSVFK